MLCLGGVGHLTAWGTRPRPVAELYDALRRRPRAARARHYDLPLVDRVRRDQSVPAKWVMEQLGLLACAAHAPLAPLGAASQERVRALLAASSDIELPAAVSS
jgi:hypothetical protein